MRMIHAPGSGGLALLASLWGTEALAIVPKLDSLVECEPPLGV